MLMLQDDFGDINKVLDEYLLTLQVGLDLWMYIENAEKFTFTVGQAYERGTAFDLTDEEFKLEISNAFDKWLGRKQANAFKTVCRIRHLLLFFILCKMLV